MTCRASSESELARLEWEERIIATVLDIRSGRVQTVSLEDVERDLGLLDTAADPTALDVID
mgnify:CR=1 FL=1